MDGALTPPLRWAGSHRGPVVASNQATPRIAELYSDMGFTVETVSAPRRIACNGNRHEAREIIASLNIAETRAR